MISKDQKYQTTLKRVVQGAYRVYLPEKYAESAAPYPLLIFLHGSGECGTDLDLLELASLPRFIRDGLNTPFITVCPQCERKWDVPALGYVLDEVLSRFKVDPGRVYCTGNSLGGLGTWQFADAYADRLAAIAPVCAPFWRINTAHFTRLPVWVFHGALDSVVPVDQSAKMVRNLQEAGCAVRFTVYPDADHDSWTATYNNPSLFDWLLTQTR